MDTDQQESLEQLVPIDIDMELDIDTDTYAAADDDETLDKTAQGEGGTSEERAVGTGEIDAIGRAAGLVVRDDKPFRGIDEVERRDERRWELDPASADEDLQPSDGAPE